MFTQRLMKAGISATATLAVVLFPVAGTAMSPSAQLAEGHRVAVDFAASAGIRAPSTRTWAATPGDYNRDGAQDVLINYHGWGSKLWKNLGNGRYHRVASYAWPTENPRGEDLDRHNCDWADVDRNGRPDLYCSAGRRETNIVKRGRDNELWLQSRNGHFRDFGTAWHAGDICGRGRNVAFLHANGDRFPDLFVGNHTPRNVPDPCNSPRLPNESSKIFINMHGNRFRYAPRYFSYGPGPGSRCAEVMDFNKDGRDDLFTCQDEQRTPRLFMNREGQRFVDVTPHHVFRWRLTDGDVADLDGDHDPDLVTSSYARFAYHLNENGHFGAQRLIARVDGHDQGRSIALGDADGDGDIDVYGMVGRGLRHNPDDWIYLNDGLGPRGLHFTAIHVPHAGGAADDVTAVRPWRNGRTAFLVLNGRKRFVNGPIQLIRVVRR